MQTPHRRTAPTGNRTHGPLAEAIRYHTAAPRDIKKARDATWQISNNKQLRDAAYIGQRRQTIGFAAGTERCSANDLFADRSGRLRPRQTISSQPEVGHVTSCDSTLIHPFVSSIIPILMCRVDKGKAPYACHHLALHPAPSVLLIPSRLHAGCPHQLRTVPPAALRAEVEKCSPQLKVWRPACWTLVAIGSAKV
ncbi:hypothetical protein EYF80_015376 [Liparis tanakae]|uniref:Uncharacterized protein n=1 Tax=Liparis tanakae TaxID=230148 RepID=A0A4Z2I8V7_9TELE|nr:hypothetical protein EYF80_015376 [Liparis tanakae]